MPEPPPMFTLTIFPGGKLLLTTPQYLNEEAARTIGGLFERWWSNEENRPLILSDVEVQHATSIEVDLTEREGVEG